MKPASLPLALLLTLSCGGVAVADEYEDAMAEGTGDFEYVEDVDERGRKTLSFGARAGAWLTVFDAELEIPSGAIAGTEVSLTSDLDFDEVVLTPYVEMFFTSRFVSLYVDAWQTENEGSATLDAEITFDGVTFAAGLPVKARYEVTTASARIHITPFAFDSFEIGAIAGARYFHAEGEIETRSGLVAEKASESIDAPLPLLGLSVRAFLGPVELYGMAYGMSIDYEYDGDDYEATYFEAEAGAAINIGDHFSVGASYRIFLIEFERDRSGDGPPDRLDSTLQGPMLWVRIRL